MAELFLSFCSLPPDVQYSTNGKNSKWKEALNVNLFPFFESTGSTIEISDRLEM